MKMSAIFNKIKISSRPTFYAGRGVTRSDMDEKKLTLIFDLIKKHHGDKATEAMLDMIENIKSMSATSVMQALYNLEENGFKYIKTEGSLIAEAIVKEATVSPGEYAATPNAMEAIKAIMVSSKEDKEDNKNHLGESIKWNFLSAHGKYRHQEYDYWDFDEREEW